jgi:hypothetical protein
MPTNAHTYIIETQLYNIMSLSSGVLIIDVCVCWYLLIFVVLFTERVGSSNTRIQYVIMCIVRDAKTEDSARAFYNVYAAFEISHISHWCPGFNSKD